MKVSKDKVLSIFSMLEQDNIEYVLLRNINDELPCNFEANKDIDILIRKECKSEFQKTMKKNGWQKVRHPWDYGNNFVFLYAMDKLEFYEKDNIHLDICYQLPCRSVNAGEWMPVDQMIQESVWENKRKNKDWQWYEMCDEDQLVHLLTRCVLDKGQFLEGYEKKIRELFNIVNEQALVDRLNGVFFKFTPVLIEMVRNEEYSKIRTSYMKFTDY